jgi:hypothetical protein
MTAAHLLPSLAQAQQSDDTSSGTSPLVTKAPAAKTQTEAAPSFDAKFTAALMSNNTFRGYTLSNNFPSAAGTFEATYSIFFASVNGASVQIPELSHFQLTNTIGLRPTFGKLMLESGFAYYSYPRSAQDLSYGEMYIAPTYAATPKLTLGLSVYYGPNYYRTGAWENYDAINANTISATASLCPPNLAAKASAPPPTPRRSSCPITSTVISARLTLTTRCHSICASMGRRCRDKAAF